MVKEKIIKTIKKYSLIKPNEHIVVGLSGGPDSVCLFNVLLKLGEEMNLTFHPVHINHKFRPGAAEKDQAYVEKLCDSVGFPCQSFVFNCEEIARAQKITSEEAGRRVRYRSFTKVAHNLVEEGIPKEMIRIAVAQNADDQVETILFRLLRGAGTDGLSGINYIRKDEEGFDVIRPLLDVTKKEVLDFCEEHKLNPCIDKTNLEPIYARNKIRLELIPYLEREYNVNIRDVITRLGKTCQADKSFLREQAGMAYSDALIESEKNQITLNGKVLRNLNKAIRQRVISIALSNIGLSEDLTFAHFESGEELIFNEKPSARIDLPRNYYMTKVYDDVKFALKTNSTELGAEIKVGIYNRDDFEHLKLKKDSYAAFDLGKLENEYGRGAASKIKLRLRKAGDYISIDANHRKKLQNYFVDSKIPRDQRDDVILTAIQSEILWILPPNKKGRYSGKYNLDKETKMVICVEIFSEI